MPGWYIHLDTAKTVAEILPGLGEAGSTALELRDLTISSFQADGPTPQELERIIRQYPNYYALGAIGPDIFFLLPDFHGETGNFIAKLAEWVIEFYDILERDVLKPWEDIMGPIEEDQTEELSRLTGGLSDEISHISSTASAIITNAALGFISRLYDWFSIFGSSVAPGYDDKLFFWSDMFHYRRTNEFARDLFEQAQNFSYNNEGGQPFTYKKGGPYGYEQGIAFALGWMTHIGTDVTGHPFVNEKSGGPYRLHWQRHHLVENHMDAYVYNDQNGTRERYNMLPNSALHFWLQFDRDNDYKPKYDYFNVFNQNNPNHFPDYPTGLKARDYFERKKAFNVDSEIPPALAYFLFDAMKVTFYKDPNEENKDNDGMPTHPMILAAIKPGENGRPDLDLMHTTYELLYKFVKYTTTDYYNMPKPQPPELFPNIAPPLPPGSRDDAPGDSDKDWDFWDALLSILAWILYAAEWIEYLVTILPALIADLATYPARYLLYLFEEALYELWKAFRFLLVMEGFIMPEPDEIDLGLIQLGMPSKGPFQGLLGLMNDVFGGLLGDNPNPVPLSEPVNNPLYPRLTVMDKPSFLSQFIGRIKEIIEPPCADLPKPCNPRQPSEFLRPWEYPFKNNDHTDIDMELGHTRASPHNVGSLPTVLLGNLPGSDEARHAYEQAATPDDADRINAERLNDQWNMGNPVFYSLYVMGQLTRDNVDSTEVASFNLDADRGYGYKCWDWDRHEFPPEVPSQVTRNPWKPPHWFVSEPANSADGPYIFTVTEPQPIEFLERNAPGKSLEQLQGTLLSPFNIAKVLLAYGFDETALWKAILSGEIHTDHPNLGVPDLVPQWILPKDQIVPNPQDPNLKWPSGYAEASGIVIRMTHPNAFPWTISNNDLALNHSTMPYQPGEDDGGDHEWTNYQHYYAPTEGDDSWKARRLAKRTHLNDMACTISEISKGDWYYRDREFPLFLDRQYFQLLNVGNCEENDLSGCLGIEAESWQLDKQVMPWFGDRIFIAGRWVIDNRHSTDKVHKHMEIHSPYIVVRYFQVPVNAPFTTDRSGPTTNSEASAALDIIVFVTGAWLGQPINTIEWDVFPPIRTDATATARVQPQQITPDTFEGFAPQNARYQNSPSVQIKAVPEGNHIHFTATVSVINPDPQRSQFRLGQEVLDERRYIAAYRISWQSEAPSPGVTVPLNQLSVAGSVLECTSEIAGQQINIKFEDLGGKNTFGNPEGVLEELKEWTEGQLLAKLCPKPNETEVPLDRVPEEQCHREPITACGYIQRYSNGSAIVWSNHTGAHVLSKNLLAVWESFYSTMGRVFFPTADSNDPNIVLGIDSFGNAASMEIVAIDGSWRAYVAMYDPVGDVLTGLQRAVARYKNDANFEYRVPCTPTLQFDQNEICFTDPQTGNNAERAKDFQLEYDRFKPLLLHYLRKLGEGEHYPGCGNEPTPVQPPPIM